MRRWVRLISNQLRNSPSKPSSFSTINNKPEGPVPEGSVPEGSYAKLDNLDFMTAAKILFTTTPPKNNKFGLDFHLVQFFFACMPSLAVYLVAQYSRYEMRRMESELEKKKKAEEEAKAKEDELKAPEEIEKNPIPDLSEVKVRLDKLEEAVKEIAVESKKQLDKTSTKISKSSEKKIEEIDAATSDGKTEAKSNTSNSEAKDQNSKEKSEKEPQLRPS